MSHPVLLTAAEQDTETIISQFKAKDVNVLYTPLEVYVMRKGEGGISGVLNDLDSFENIVYSNKRNAGFFLQQVERFDKEDAVKERLNLAINRNTFEFLESHSIPAVHPQEGEKPIDLVELMLRLQRMGKTLYPCGSHQREDFPGFLEELEIEVLELDVFELEGPADDDLNSYRKAVEEQQPKTVVFHSRRSVNRTMAAFPELDYENVRVISADKAITNKLQENGIEADEEADGSWPSIAELV